MSEDYINVGTEGHCDYKQPTPTQEQVDEIYQEILLEWQAMKDDSEYNENMFVIMDKRVAPFLARYQYAKGLVEEAGLTIPDLQEGLTVTLGDSDE